MLIKEYLESGNSIISNTTQALFSDFLTSEGQTVINNNFKYEYFNREMVTTGQAHIDELAQYVLLKNKLEYSKIYDSLMTTIDPTKITSKESNSGKDSKNNTGTQGNTTTFGKTVTTTPDEQTVTTIPAAHTVTTTPAGDTVTHTPTGYTDTHTLPGHTVAESGSEQNTVTKSNKAFDSTNFEEVEKEVSNRVPTNKQQVTTYQNNETTQHTYTGNETTTTVYNNNASEVTTYQNNESVTNVVNHAGSAVESGTEGTTRTDNLKEELTHGHIIDREEKDPRAIIDNFEKLREFYSLNLWNRITADLVHFICLDVWNTSYFDL